MKKYLSIMSLAGLVFLISGLVTGCSLLPVSQDNSEESQTTSQTTTETQAEQPAESMPIITPMSDAELEQEIENIDAELGKVKTTGFESTNLTDKDLGL